MNKISLILQLWQWSYENSTIVFEDSILQCDPSPYMTTLPSFNELDQSLNAPNPPSRVYNYDSMDRYIFERLEKKFFFTWYIYV